MADQTIVYSKQTGEPSVPVTVRIEWLPNGTIKPCLFWVPDGSCFAVKYVYEMTPLTFLKDRGEGIRFKVKSEVKEMSEPDSDHQLTQLETYLYFADNWLCGKTLLTDGMVTRIKNIFL